MQSAAKPQRRRPPLAPESSSRNREQEAGYAAAEAVLRFVGTLHGACLGADDRGGRVIVPVGPARPGGALLAPLSERAKAV